VTSTTQAQAFSWFPLLFVHAADEIRHVPPYMECRHQEGKTLGNDVVRLRLKRRKRKQSRAVGIEAGFDALFNASLTFWSDGRRTACLCGAARRHAIPVTRRLSLLLRNTCLGSQNIARIIRVVAPPRTVAGLFDPYQVLKDFLTRQRAFGLRKRP
jgi:hypothetical protein